MAGARALCEDKTIRIQYAAEPNTHATEALTFHGVEVSKRNAALVAKQKGTSYNDFVRENPDAGHAVDRRAFVCHRIFLGSSAEIEGEAFGRHTQRPPGEMDAYETLRRSGVSSARWLLPHAMCVLSKTLPSS